MLFTYAKVMAYLLEYHFMRLLARTAGWPIAPLPKLSKDQKSTLNSAFKALLNQWKEVLKKFPHCNPISSPILHFDRFLSILKDLKIFLIRKNNQESHDLKGITFKQNDPEYFKRNYHYQTDGYFSFDSAKRYDHQVELLFLGSAHIMRKVAYSTLAATLKGGFEVLEFGAGSGTSGHQFKQVFPEASLDLLDPSTTYLDYARTTYPQSFNAFIPEFMENFRPNKKYDCIFSCFIMHEIPVKYWDSVTVAIKEALKKGGHLLIIDSQQNCDKIEHQFALDQFAEDYFEPYFQEFRETSLEEYFTQKGFKLISKTEVLFSKALLFSLSV